MIEFRDMMDTLFELQRKFPDMEWDCRDGILSIRAYVGIANSDLLGQARTMFAD